MALPPLHAVEPRQLLLKEVDASRYSSLLKCYTLHVLPATTDFPVLLYPTSFASLPHYTLLDPPQSGHRPRLI